MKKIIMILSMLLTLIVGVEMLPLIGNSRKLAKIEGMLDNKIKPEPTKKLPKHNLNNGQLKRMNFLKYIDKV